MRTRPVLRPDHGVNRLGVSILLRRAPLTSSPPPALPRGVRTRYALKGIAQATPRATPPPRSHAPRGNALPRDAPASRTGTVRGVPSGQPLKVSTFADC